jgi:hypothetical protein
VIEALNGRGIRWFTLRQHGPSSPATSTGCWPAACPATRPPPDKLWRHFLDTGGTLQVTDDAVTCALNLRSYHPVLIDSGFADLHVPIPWWQGRMLRFRFPSRHPQPDLNSLSAPGIETNPNPQRASGTDGTSHCRAAGSPFVIFGSSHPTLRRSLERRIAGATPAVATRQDSNGDPTAAFTVLAGPGGRVGCAETGMSCSRRGT